MSVTKKYGLYGVGLGAAVLGGITRQNLMTGTQIQSEATDGDVWARIQVLHAQKVAPGFTTLNAASALAACGPLGANIANMAGGMILYLQQHLAGGTRTTGGVHRSLAFSAGILAPKSLSVSHRQDANLSYEALLTSDGVNAPVTISDVAALPAAPADLERFTLGPATLAGVALGEKTSLQLDFGIDVVGESADGDIYDSFASIRQVRTSITLKGIDPTWFAAANVPLLGLHGTTANSTIYLRKRVPGGSFASGANHICLTVSGILYCDEAVSVSGNDPSETSVRMLLDFDGTNAPLTINTAANLPG
ncbi:MAG: hypothetical protein ABSG68_11380 [Thermoguttaceae bacterium]